MCGDDGQHLDGNTVELIEATPAAAHGETGENLAESDVVHLLGAVEDVASNTQVAREILRRFGLACTGGACGGATAEEAERLRESDVAAIGELRDDEATAQTDVLVTVCEFGVADLDDAATAVERGLVAPVVAELILPSEALGVVGALFVDESCDDVAVVHFDGDEVLEHFTLVLGESRLRTDFVDEDGQDLLLLVQELAHGFAGTAFHGGEASWTSAVKKIRRATMMAWQQWLWIQSVFFIS